MALADTQKVNMKSLDLFVELLFYGSQIIFGVCFYKYCQNDPNGVTYCLLGVYGVAVAAGIRGSK